VTNEDIAEARIVPGDGPSTFGADITLSTRGAEKMSRASSNHIGKLIAILIDRQIVAAPTLRGPISKLAAISGLHTRAEAQRIADGMIGR
jgi:preprotein translocase subunit SecD